MDIVWFLQRRLEFIRTLYGTTTAPFCETMEKIRAGEPPYVDGRNPEYQDVSEPAFLSEYLEASEAVEVVGHWCLMMVYASLKAFLEEYVAEMAGTYRDAFSDAQAKLAAMKPKNWFERYRLYFLQEFQIDWHKSPVKLEDLEQINLARDDLVHNVNVTTTYIYQTEKHAERFPKSLFTDEMWVGLGLGHRIKVGSDELATASQIVDSFCGWLEDIRKNYLGHIRSLAERPPSNADR